MRGRRTIRTAKNRRAVLAALAEGWSVHATAARAGIGYTSLHDWRRDDPLFAAEVEAAMDASTDLLEDEARRRALDQSDLLLIFLLRSRRPRVYNRKQVEAVGSVAAAPPIAIPHSGSRKNVVFYIPRNGRDQPERDEQPATIEGPAEGEVA